VSPASAEPIERSSSLGNETVVTVKSGQIESAVVQPVIPAVAEAAKKNENKVEVGEYAKSSPVDVKKQKAARIKETPHEEKNIAQVGKENSSSKPDASKSKPAQKHRGVTNSTDLVISLKSNPAKKSVQVVEKSVAEKPKKTNTSVVNSPAIKATPKHVSSKTTDKILDGALVPEIAGIEIGAVAYSEMPEDSLAVLNQQLMRQGDVLGSLRLVHIGKEELIFILGGNKYRRVFGNRNENDN